MSVFGALLKIETPWGVAFYQALEKGSDAYSTRRVLVFKLEVRWSGVNS